MRVRTWLISALLAAGMLVLASIVVAAPRARHRTTKAHFACTKQNEYLGLVLMAASGEADTQEAFKNELVRALMADECTTFHAGEGVSIVASSDGLRKISFNGRGTRAWWTTPTVIQ